MSYQESNPTHGAIPDGTVVKCRVRWGERRITLASGQPLTAYRVEMEVAAGPYAGSKVYRTMWDSPGGREVMRRDLAKLGIDDPDDLCRPLSREYVVRARITRSRDWYREPCNGVQWFEVVNDNALPKEGSQDSDRPRPSSNLGTTSPSAPQTDSGSEYIVPDAGGDLPF